MIDFQEVLSVTMHVFEDRNLQKGNVIQTKIASNTEKNFYKNFLSYLKFSLFKTIHMTNKNFETPNPID